MILFPQTNMKKIIDGVRQHLCRDYFLCTDISMETRENRLNRSNKKDFLPFLQD